ncbi:hypothetical protein KKF91_15620 [Myxococcota bacterium]|nr:hypothetical protein [Myxococcota bacterium]MBU1431970.1 hypothetical protein [Myxococcota bacterium]
MAWRNSPEIADRSIADLFAGLSIALLLILVVLLIQALSDTVRANEDRRKAEEYKKKMQQMEAVQSIFQTAFSSLESDGEIISVDKNKGEITLGVQQIFAPGSWKFKPSSENYNTFVKARTKLADLLDDIDHQFKINEIARSLKMNAHDHVEILIVGHTDCKLFHRKNIGLLDNWDLSTLRAAALARFFTEKCDDPDNFFCCSNGKNDCPDLEKIKRVDPSKWRVLPAGRSQFEPRSPSPTPLDYRVRCDGQGDEKWLQEQRRVVIQIVPRLDRVAVRVSASTL